MNNVGWRKFKKNKLAVIGTIILFVLFMLALLAPILTDMDISKVDLGKISAKPDKIHILGTDEVGRDVFARLTYGQFLSILLNKFHNKFNF